MIFLSLDFSSPLAIVNTSTVTAIPPTTTTPITIFSYSILILTSSYFCYEAGNIIWQKEKIEKRIGKGKVCVFRNACVKEIYFN